MRKTITIVASDIESTPLQFLSGHDGYCESDSQVLESFQDIRQQGLRFKGAWRITVEKVEPRIVKTLRAKAFALRITESKEKE